MSDRPLKKKRLELCGEAPGPLSEKWMLLNNGSATNITILHQQQQIESLQSELDHERASRALDAKKSANALSQAHQQVAFAVSEAKTSKEFMNETVEQAEKRVEQLTKAKDGALALNRQLQLQLAQVDEDADNEQENEYNLTLYQSKCERLQEQLDAATETEAAYKREIDELKETVNSKLKETRELANKAPELPNVEMAPSAVMRELNKCRIQMAESERKCRQLQAKSETLSERNHELVRESEKYKTQAKRLPVVSKQLETANRTHEGLLAEIKVWNDFSNTLNRKISRQVRSTTGPPEISTILRFVETAQQDCKEAKLAEAKAKQECIEIEEKLQSERCNDKAKDEKSAVLVKKQLSHEIQLDTATQKYVSAERKATLYQRENESLRTLMETFEQQLKSGSRDINPSLQTAQLELAAMTEQLKLAESLKDGLSTELTSCQIEKLELSTELDRVRQKFMQLRDALMSEKEKVSVAEQRAIEAEQLAGKGSYDPQLTRVLHFTETPLVQALKEELAVLKRQLEAMNEGNKLSRKSCSSGGVKSELAADPDKLNQRLKENFKEQINLFRDGVYLMTGFKVDMLTNTERPTFRLRSVFAEQEEDSLMLQWPKGKTKDDATSLDILNTDLAKVLTTTPSYEYMEKFHSLPAFLASVQLMLFEKQTVMM